MEQLQSFFSELIAGGDLVRYLVLGVILAAVSMVLGSIGKSVFGERSLFGSAVSSSIAIVFLYALTAAFLALGGKYAAYAAPLPFVTMDGDTLTFFTFGGKGFSTVFTQIMNTVILAFVVSLADRFLPRGKNFFAWLFFRVSTVCIGLFAHLFVNELLLQLIPQGIAQYAPIVLLAVLVLMLLTGALKILVGVLLSTVNPIIGALYTFFFANVVGKQITRSVLTTVLLCLLVYGLEVLGISAIGISTESLILYIPYGAGLLGLWYLCNRLF
ncbi:MAG: hypothetical protein E7435_01535 [Ruminococcaceae bacterium]|nr:hypothetical protein [Oscillospiraceae bacterium]